MRGVASQQCDIPMITERGPLSTTHGGSRKSLDDPEAMVLPLLSRAGTIQRVPPDDGRISAHYEGNDPTSRRFSDDALARVLRIAACRMKTDVSSVGRDLDTDPPEPALCMPIGALRLVDAVDSLQRSVER